MFNQTPTQILPLLAFNIPPNRSKWKSLKNKVATHDNDWRGSAPIVTDGVNIRRVVRCPIIIWQNRMCALLTNFERIFGGDEARDI